ncbi:MAG: hypothetical protein ACOYL8_04300 [Patescibacteria group bacterium]
MYKAKAIKSEGSPYKRESDSERKNFVPFHAVGKKYPTIHTNPITAAISEIDKRKFTDFG